jgi:hypothetical protein
MEENMQILTVTELAALTPLELVRLYNRIGSGLPGTRMGSPERRAIELTLANIRYVLARRHRTPR